MDLFECFKTLAAGIVAAKIDGYTVQDITLHFCKNNMPSTKDDTSYIPFYESNDSKTKFSISDLAKMEASDIASQIVARGTEDSITRAHWKVIYPNRNTTASDMQLQYIQNLQNHVQQGLLVQGQHQQVTQAYQIFGNQHTPDPMNDLYQFRPQLQHQQPPQRAGRFSKKLRNMAKNIVRRSK